MSPSGLRSRPFATAVGAVVMFSGIAAMIDLHVRPIFVLDPDLESLLPRAGVLVLSGAYGVSGALLLLGMFCRRGNVEAAGCIGIAATSVARSWALIGALGINRPVLGTLLLYGVVVGAALERLYQILRHQLIVVVEGDGAGPE